MNKVETLEGFYKKQFNSIPESLWNEIGHFDVFSFDDYASCALKPIPYSFRNYLKIGLMFGKYKVDFSDKTYEVKKHALLFASSQVPYSWKPAGEKQHGYFCVFTESFFHHFGNPRNYSVFQPEGTPLLELTGSQAKRAKQLFDEMLAEWASDSIHKYDKMRMLVFELLYSAEKLQPIQQNSRYYPNASQKIATQFLKLLEQQFSAENIELRSASAFAERLSVHVNHLNKALHEVLHKSTSVIIQERILVEAKILLKHTNKDVAEIAFILGFKESTHFHNFFKKHTKITPTQFRIDGK
ncbi:MAG TPA: helix-turn-helix domain-containing protein [Arachidicoccus sp.]